MDIAPEVKIQIIFNPTLFIFCGTKAGKVGWRLKKLLYNAYGDIPVLKFLFLDIDKDVDQEQEKWVDDLEERVEMSGYDVATVRESLPEHPYIEAWWPVHVNPGGIMGAGAKNQMRLIGRMAFFRRLADDRNGFTLSGKLEDTLNSLRQIDNQIATGNRGNEIYTYSVDASQLNVFMIFSPCGGTGSGTAFDLAYLCRHLLEGTNATITSMNMAPSVFLQEIQESKDVQRQKVQANAYAWFKENNYLIENPAWDVAYKDGLRVLKSVPPFDFSYIIDIENQNNQRLRTLDDIANMMAQALFLSTGTAINRAHEGFLAIVAKLNSRFGGKKRVYSTLATSSLIFPQERLKKYCAHKYAVEMIENGILKKYAAKIDVGSEDNLNVIQTNVTAIRNRNELNIRNLLAQFMGVGHLQYSYVQKIKKAEDVKSSLAAIGEQETECNESLLILNQKMDVKQASLLNAKKGLIEKEVLDCIRQYGVVGIIDILTQLAESLKRDKDDMLKRGETAANVSKEQEEYDREKKILKQLDDGFEDQLHRMMRKSHWQKSFRNQKDICIKEMKERYDTEHRVYAQEHVVKLLDDLIADITTNKIVELENIKTPMEDVKSSIEGSLAKLKAKSAADTKVYELLKEVDVDFDKYYSRFAPAMGEYGNFRFVPPTITSMNALQKWVVSQFKNTLIQFSADLFDKQLSRISLLDVMEELAREKGVQPKQYVADQIHSLLAYCAPFFRYNPDKGMSAPEKTTIIGVEEKDHTLLESINPAKVSMVSTGMKGRIDVVVFQHGLPIHVLQGMTSCKQLYEQLLTPSAGQSNPDDPLHILPGINRFSLDIFPDKGAVHRNTFVLGLAFDFIFSRGSKYYMDLNKQYKTRGGRPPASDFLASGRREAAVAFSQNPNFVKSVEDALEDEKFNQSGDDYKKFVQEKISEWYDKISSRTSSTDREGLKTVYQEEVKILEEYLQEISQ